jgi:hypothetical protein
MLPAQCRTAEGGVVADKFKADLVALHHGSNHMSDAVGEAAVDFISHEDALAEAAPGWIGSSQAALSELATRWEALHGHHKLRVGKLGSHVADVMVDYATTEEKSAGDLRSLQG